ncbi:unnamed protein product, partial [Allacma fusca]
KNLPPGPIFSLPILGHLPSLGNNPSKTLLQWGKIYGPILHVQLGSYGAMVLNDSQLIRKAFNLNSFAGRPHNKLFDRTSGNRRGFSFSDGPNAVEQRKLAQRLLKAFGIGTNSMESHILDQIPSLLDVFEDHLTKPLDVKHAFNRLQQLAVNVSRLAEMSTVVEKLSYFIKVIPDWFPELSGFNEKVRVVLFCSPWKYYNHYTRFIPWGC